MFLLYQKKDKVYPESVKIGGDWFFINAGFKNILRIFDMLDDENIPEVKKICKLREWFFVDDLPEGVSSEVMAEAFVGFLTTPPAGTPPRRGMGVGTGETGRTGETGERERQFCYNFDAGEIYAGFLSEYDIDLIEADLHWYKFRILLENLSPESAFKRKIELRFMDLNDYSGRKFAELAEAKEAVQLPERGMKSYEKSQELQEVEEFNEIWGKAGS